MSRCNKIIEITDVLWGTGFPINVITIFLYGSLNNLFKVLDSFIQIFFAVLIFKTILLILIFMYNKSVIWYISVKST